MLSVNNNRTLWTVESIKDRAAVGYAAACCLNIKVNNAH
jgi:hypothetical protein